MLSCTVSRPPLTTKALHQVAITRQHRTITATLKPYWFVSMSRGFPSENNRVACCAALPINKTTLVSCLRIILRFSTCNWPHNQITGPLESLRASVKGLVYKATH